MVFFSSSTMITLLFRVVVGAGGEVEVLIFIDMWCLGNGSTGMIGLSGRAGVVVVLAIFGMILTGSMGHVNMVV